MLRLKSQLLRDLKESPDPLHALKEALKTAIELEHATLPTYLYALYSLKPGSNFEIASLIKSIVLQEMLHMALDCNILNAIHGKPAIDDPKFIPKYPGPLPGGIEQGLIVSLAPFSKQHLFDTFMVIEEPEDPLRFPVLRTAAAEEAPPDHITIGEYYAGIKDQIRALSAQGNIFTGDPKRQLTTGFPELHDQIHNADSAIAAIDLIVEQGEGTTTSPLDPEHEPAHYYRFAEIYYGKKLIPNPKSDPKPDDPKFVYGGHKIDFDPCGVWPVITNPSPASYPAGSKLANLNATFNYTYTNMLKALNLVFNGEPDRLGPAIGLMESLKEQAMVMMSTEMVPGQTGGPTFEYLPVLTV